jgi:hypothetical protein
MPSIAHVGSLGAAGAARRGRSAAGRSFLPAASTKAARFNRHLASLAMSFLTHAAFYAMLVLAVRAGIWGHQRQVE